MATISVLVLGSYTPWQTNEGHGFSRVPMSLRLTEGDENHGESYFSTQVSMGRGCFGTGAIEAVAVSDPEHAFEPMSVRRCGNAKTVRDCA